MTESLSPRERHTELEPHRKDLVHRYGVALLAAGLGAAATLGIAVLKNKEVDHIEERLQQLQVERSQDRDDFQQRLAEVKEAVTRAERAQQAASAAKDDAVKAKEEAEAIAVDLTEPLALAVRECPAVRTESVKHKIEVVRGRAEPLNHTSLNNQLGSLLSLIGSVPTNPGVAIQPARPARAKKRPPRANLDDIEDAAGKSRIERGAAEEVEELLGRE